MKFSAFLFITKQVFLYHHLLKRVNILHFAFLHKFGICLLSFKIYFILYTGYSRIKKLSTLINCEKKISLFYVKADVLADSGRILKKIWEKNSIQDILIPIYFHDKIFSKQLKDTLSALSTPVLIPSPTTFRIPSLRVASFASLEVRKKFQNFSDFDFYDNTLDNTLSNHNFHIVYPSRPAFLFYIFFCIYFRTM